MAAKIAQYKIVTHSDPKDTEDEVNAFLADGWELYGELRVIEYWAGGESDDARCVYSHTQAMVRRFAAGD